LVGSAFELSFTFAEPAYGCAQKVQRDSEKTRKMAIFICKG
jgi:hypothetical protein